MSKVDRSLDVCDGDFAGCTLTTILCSSVTWDDPVFWTDASSVKDAIDKLTEVSVDLLQPLDEVKVQLSTNPSRHGEFIQFGGVNELWRLLKNGNSIVQRKCLRAIEVLAINEEPRKHLREIGIGDTLLEIIRASSRKPDSTRRAKAGQILKLIAGNSSSARLFDEIPKKLPSRRNVGKLNSSSLHRDQTPSSPSTRHLARDITRERPLPFWYHSTYPNLPWDSETVSCLVDLLLSDALEGSHNCAYRVIKKILYCGQFSRHVVIDSADVSELITIISSMHSTAVIAVKAVTFASIMHSANGQNFIRLGGLEALVNAIKSDNIGSVCGELSAWSLCHFCETSAGSAKKVIDANGAEALTELSHSFDYCSREAAVHAIVSMLRKSDQDRKQVIERFGEAGVIVSLLDILKDGQDNPRRHAITQDTLRALLELSRVQTYRREIIEKGGMTVLHGDNSQCGEKVEKTTKKLMRTLTSPSQRISQALKSANPKKKSVRSSIVKKLKRFFKSEKKAGHVSSRQSLPPSPEDLTNDLRSVSRTESKLVSSQRSLSSLSSSIQSDYNDGLLATAPGGPRTHEVVDFLDDESPTFQTFSLQQFHSLDKDFDPIVFGGRGSGHRSRTLAFVSEEDKNELTLSSSTDAKASGTSTTNSELITTNDFI